MKRKPSDIKRAQRYRVLRAHGVAPGVCSYACQSAARFADAVTLCRVPKLGLAPLCKVVPGGWPRVADTPKAAARRARYARLRALGASAEVANAWSGSEASTATCARRLCQK